MVAQQFLGLLSLLPSLVYSQAPQLSEFFNITTFPNEQKANVTRYLNEAAALATDSAINQYFQEQCIEKQVYPTLFKAEAGYVTPFLPFNNLYFVGHSYVSAWAYNTSEGIVLINALDNQEEVKAILIPGLESFGLSGADIKHLIITHEHGDHYGRGELYTGYVPSSYLRVREGMGGYGRRWDQTRSRLFQLGTRSSVTGRTSRLEGLTSIPSSCADIPRVLYLSPSPWWI
ncbi:uncharacterized protein BDV17DRAFT_295813 [Aspergillus undulatus]|uniref:uncharacterized protein n=1 Tax=Aspergillus undulatus TaxID=1810928 RepID=UPI003CCDB124